MAGRPRDLNTVDLECLRELIETRKTRRLRKITSMFAGLYVDISMSTIYRRMREPIDDGGLGLSRKKQTRININADPAAQVDFLNRIAHVASSRLYNVDGIVQTKVDFRDQFAWELKGRPAVYNQILLHDKSYPCVVCADERGVVTWQRYHPDFRGWLWNNSSETKLDLSLVQKTPSVSWTMLRIKALTAYMLPLMKYLEKTIGTIFLHIHH